MNKNQPTSHSQRQVQRRAQKRMPISRRTALKIGSGLLAAVPFVITRAPSAWAQTDPTPTAEMISTATPQPQPEPTQAPTQALAPAALAPSTIPTATRRPFGRSLRNGAVVREQPSVKAAIVRSLQWGEVVPTLAEVSGDGPSSYNPIWYQTSDGWIHSSMVQPTENTLNEPLPSVDPNGIWGEITVPIAEARGQADPKARAVDRYYYGCIVRISEVVAGSDGAAYYRIRDGNGGGGFFVAAAQVRPISAEEFTPISGDVPLEAKRIEVNLRQQIATAFENDQPVFTARVATGARFRVGGQVVNFGTIPGDHRIFLKIPGQRMVGGLAGDSDYYNLPGVSWVSYFTASGIAFHGAYWHNDYGNPRSHGCVNMLPEDAKWVFRWTMPSVDAATGTYTRTAKRNDGSYVKVF